MSERKTLNGEPVFSTSEVCAKLGFSVNVKFLKECGATPMVSTGVGCYWRTVDFPLICLAIRKRLEKIGAAA